MNQQDKILPPQNLSTAKPSSTQNLEMLRPEDDKKIKIPKRHGLRNFLITLLIIIIILVIAIAATGLYNIPIISSIFKVNQPKDLGVATSPQALASIKEKVTLSIAGEETNYSSGNADIFSGEIAVDTQFTAEEITSWLHEYQRPDPILSDLQVRQFEGGLEISAMANQYIKAPVYAKVNINLINPQTVSLDIQQGKLGIFSVPDKYLQQIEDALEDQVNDLINRIPGFSIETYELHDGYSNFKGTFPETVKPSPNGWSDLMNY
ncbi:hypothetical protein KKF61_06500 [Patescibacteria group bacterium]|nr:hypothetical protein [Patescibacteria group bacterium]